MNGLHLAFMGLTILCIYMLRTRPVRAYLERASARKDLELFDRGYDYAEEAMLEGVATPKDLQAELDMFADQSTSFDLGIDKAISDLIENKQVIDNRKQRIEK